MDKNGTRTAMLSITNPGLCFGDRVATRMPAPVSQILFGTDFPSAGTIDTSLKGLHAFELDTADLRAIERDNAVRLVPRLANGSGRI